MSIPNYEPEVKAVEGCSRCKGFEYTDRIMHVCRPGGLTSVIKFDYCPCCGRMLKNPEEPAAEEEPVHIEGREPEVLYGE